ncbi:unnamed protein product [Polarella glacialis]|uniref:Uncharacterized protein n=1 Tax=Polarella glacialis TaxID=89957 RepID=A0A813DGW8_POLGL|nr:unnamed protein product [Polarella glacialis]
MYMAPVSAPNALELNRQLWSWHEQLLATLPARCLPITLLDANARFGSQVLALPDGAVQVGNWGTHVENAAGRVMCEFLEKTNFAAVNAVFANAASCTWHNTRGHAARIDYILTSTTALEYTTLATVDHRLGFLLQLPDTTMLADHSPVFWHFRHPCPMPGRRQETWTRRKVQNLCFDGEGAQRLISAVDKWAASDQVQNAANAAEEEQRVDSLWELLNEGVRSQLNNSKQLSDLNNFLTERKVLKQQNCYRGAGS